MISRMFGAPLRGVMVGGHHGLEVFASSVMVPPNLGSGAGIWLPGIVVVALGEPSVPVTTCATAGVAAHRPAATKAAMVAAMAPRRDIDVMCRPPSMSSLD
jgi:hypothetical protein